MRYHDAAIFADFLRSHIHEKLRQVVTIEIYNGDSMSSLLWFWHGDNVLLPNLARW
jgi:hypothetical protein